MCIYIHYTISVFQKGPPVPPSQAQAAIVEAAAHEDYTGSLRRLFQNKSFLLLMATYGKVLSNSNLDINVTGSIIFLFALGKVSQGVERK